MPEVFIPTEKTAVTILCPKCNTPTIPVYSQQELQFLNGSEAHALVDCVPCNKTYAYYPMTGQLVEE